MSKKYGVKTTTMKPLLSPLMSSGPPFAACTQGSKEGRDNTSFLILSERGRKVKYGINRKRTLYFTLCELDKT